MPRWCTSALVLQQYRTCIAPPQRQSRSSLPCNGNAFPCKLGPLPHSHYPPSLSVHVYVSVAVYTCVRACGSTPSLSPPPTCALSLNVCACVCEEHLSHLSHLRPLHSHPTLHVRECVSEPLPATPHGNPSNKVRGKHRITKLTLMSQAVEQD